MNVVIGTVQRSKGLTFQCKLGGMMHTCCYLDCNLSNLSNQVIIVKKTVRKWWKIPITSSKNPRWRLQTACFDRPTVRIPKVLNLHSYKKRETVMTITVNWLIKLVSTFLVTFPLVAMMHTHSLAPVVIFEGFTDSWFSGVIHPECKTHYYSKTFNSASPWASACAVLLNQTCASLPAPLSGSRTPT